MRESIGGTQLFIIVVVLVILFSGIMALTINRANAFAVKDKIVQIIEKYEGFDTKCDTANCSDKDDKEALEEIVELLKTNSYRNSGQCDDSINTTGPKGFQRDGRHSSGNKASSFCIYKIKNSGNITSYYYKVEVFYSLDIPVLKSVFRLKTTGETKKLYR